MFTLTWETRVVRKYPLHLSVSLVLFWCSEKPPTFNSNLRDVKRWLLQDKWKFHFYWGIGRQRGRGHDALAKVIGTTAIPFLHEYIVPAAKHAGADLLEFAPPEKAYVVSGRWNFKTAAKSVGRQTLRKQLGSDSREKSARWFLQIKSAKQNELVAKRIFYKIFSIIMSKTIRYQSFVAVSGNLGKKGTKVDDDLLSHEQLSYPTFSLT